MTDREKLRLWLDAVESGVCAECNRIVVIRCKDCKYWDNRFGLCDDDGLCTYGGYKDKNAYCSSAERKD